MRDSMAKSLYSALFDWIVFRINHALLNARDLEETTEVSEGVTSPKSLRLSSIFFSAPDIKSRILFLAKASG